MNISVFKICEDPTVVYRVLLVLINYGYQGKKTTEIPLYCYLDGFFFFLSERNKKLAKMLKN